MIAERKPARGERRPLVRPGGREGGIELDIPPRGGALESLDFHVLADAAVVAAVVGPGPDLMILLAGIAADGVEAPNLRALGPLEAEGGEGNGDFDAVSPILDPGGRVVDHVPVVVFDPRRVGQAVDLDAGGRRDQGEGPPGVVVGVDLDGHPVVAARLVPLAVVGPDLGRFGVVTAKSEIQVGLAVGDQDFGADRRGDVFPGGDFVVELQDPGRGPGFLVEDPVDLDGVMRFGVWYRGSPPSPLPVEFVRRTKEAPTRESLTIRSSFDRVAMGNVSSTGFPRPALTQERSHARRKIERPVECSTPSDHRYVRHRDSRRSRPGLPGISPSTTPPSSCNP